MALGARLTGNLAIGQSSAVLVAALSCNFGHLRRYGSRHVDFYLSHDLCATMRRLFSGSQPSTSVCDCTFVEVYPAEKARQCNHSWPTEWSCGDCTLVGELYSGCTCVVTAACGPAILSAIHVLSYTSIAINLLCPYRCWLAASKGSGFDGNNLWVRVLRVFGLLHNLSGSFRRVWQSFAVLCCTDFDQILGKVLTSDKSKQSEITEICAHSAYLSSWYFPERT